MLRRFFSGGGRFPGFSGGLCVGFLLVIDEQKRKLAKQQAADVDISPPITTTTTTAATTTTAISVVVVADDETLTLRSPPTSPVSALVSALSLLSFITI